MEEKRRPVNPCLKSTILLLVLFTGPAFTMGNRVGKSVSLRPPSSTSLPPQSPSPQFSQQAEKSSCHVVIEEGDDSVFEQSALGVNPSLSPPVTPASSGSTRRVVFYIAESENIPAPSPKSGNQELQIPEIPLTDQKGLKRFKTASSTGSSLYSKKRRDEARKQGRRSGLNPEESGILAISMLPPDQKELITTLLSHRSGIVIKQVFELLRKKGFVHAFEIFLELPRGLRRDLFYVPYSHLLSKEYRKISSKEIRGMSLQANLTESVYELRHNGKWHYLGPVIFNTVIYGASATAVILAQAYLPLLALVGAYVMGEETNLRAVCDLIIAGHNFELNINLLGSLFERLQLTPEGFLANVGIGTLVVFGPGVVRAFLMPLAMKIYIEIYGACLDKQQKSQSQRQALQAGQRLKDLSRLRMGDKAIIDFLSCDQAKKSLGMLAKTPSRGLKFTEIMARLSPSQGLETKKQKIADVKSQRHAIFQMLRGLKARQHNKGDESSRPVGKCLKCFIRAFDIKEPRDDNPSNIECCSASYAVCCVKNSGKRGVFIKNVITGGAVFCFVTGVGALVPYFSAVDGPQGSASAVVGPPALNRTCHNWLEEGFPNSTIIEAPLKDINGSPTSLFLVAIVSVGTGIGLPVIVGAVRLLVDGIAALCSTCKNCLCPQLVPEEEEDDLDDGETWFDAEGYSDSFDKLAERIEEISLQELPGRCSDNSDAHRPTEEVSITIENATSGVESGDLSERMEQMRLQQ